MSFPKFQFRAIITGLVAHTMSHKINKAFNIEFGIELHPGHCRFTVNPEPGSCKIKLAGPIKLTLDK